LAKTVATTISFNGFLSDQAIQISEAIKRETLLYGPADGDWVELVALQGAGFAIDCMELTAHILGLRSQRDFDLLFKPLLKRNDEMMQRFRGLFLEEAQLQERRSPGRKKPK